MRIATPVGALRADPDRDQARRGRRPSGGGGPAEVPGRQPTLGELVRLRRRANGLSQSQLGELAGVGRRLIVEIEAGKPTLRMDAVNAVLAVFGKALGVVEARRPEIEAW